VELTQLRIFVAAAEAGSFSRAAEALHLSQSAVSPNVRALERALDAQLFVRQGRAIHLRELISLFRSSRLHSCQAVLDYSQSRI
jgi:DNA-binding transcriptional LysR family regulator